MNHPPPTNSIGPLTGCRVLPPMYPKAKTTAAEAPKPADGKSDRRAMGRFGVLNRFSDHGARLVDTTAQACWWILFRETQPDGLATVSHLRIAECIGMNRKTVTRPLARLESAGLLIVVRQGGWQRGPSTYRVYGAPKRPKTGSNPSTTGEHY